MLGLLSARFSSFYAALFFLAGVQLPFWPVWLAGRGLSAAEIAAVLAIGQWTRIIANPLAGYFADRVGDKRAIMVPLSVIALAGLMLMQPARNLAVLLLLNTATGVCLAALLPLGDSVALSSANSGSVDYGRVRLWGSLGFIAATLLTGRLLLGRNEETVLYILIGGTVVIAAASCGLPRARPPGARPARSGLSRLWSIPFLRFLVAATLIQGSHSVYYAFGTLYWQSLGLSDFAIAALWAEGVVGEIALFYWGEPAVRKFGPSGLLALAGAAGILRWTATPLVASLPVLSALQLLHAFTFGAAHLGAMHYLARNIPPEQAASGQTLYAAVVGGVGPGLFTLLSGALYVWGGGVAYAAMAVLAAAGMAISLGLSATKY